MTSQLKLPSPETYERELAFMPYKKSLAMVRDIVCRDAPKDGRGLDLMCGPGYLLGQIKQRRQDLHLFGADIDERYIEYARKQNRGIDFFLEDVLNWKAGPFDVVLCTGALHHIPYEKQEEVVAKIAQLTKPEGFAIISDCYIDDYKDEKGRQLSAAELGYEYLRATIKHGSPTPSEVVKATTEIITNDVCGLEFKTSIAKRLPILWRNFSLVKTMKTWPDRQIGDYGDYVHVLRK
jgi:2-polyprenyl-3-methyl-5-hydroxy-6-metoxy-1,4-benzoquinol methylase